MTMLSDSEFRRIMLSKKNVHVYAKEQYDGHRLTLEYTPNDKETFDQFIQRNLVTLSIQYPRIYAVRHLDHGLPFEGEWVSVDEKYFVLFFCKSCIHIN